MNDLHFWLSALATVAVALLGFAALKHVFVFGQPDEWLLLIRGGKLVRAGIGITALRLPGDSVVRFSSTLQRVAFQAEARSAEHVPLIVEGFALWTVRGEGEGPFRAFRTLGIANLDERNVGLRSPRHLLTAPQYKAFQALFSACVQRLAPRRSLPSMLDDPEDLLDALSSCVAENAEEFGIRIDQIQILAIRPRDQELIDHLSASKEALMREEAQMARLQVQQRMARHEIASEQELANERARAEVDKEAFAAEQAVELQRRKLEAAREQARLEQERLQAEEQTETFAIHMRDRLQKARGQSDLEAKRAEDEAAQEQNAARLARARDDLSFDVESTRARARAEHDAIIAVAEAEEKKTPSVREAQLIALLATKAGEAVAHLPIKDVHWTSWTGGSPLEGLGRTFGEIRHFLASDAVGRSKASEDPSA
jgi:hypothetical protein